MLKNHPDGVLHNASELRAIAKALDALNDANDGDNWFDGKFVFAFEGIQMGQLVSDLGSWSYYPEAGYGLPDLIEKETAP